MFFQEQKSLAVMKILVEKHSPPGHNVYEPFACIYAAWRGCMLLPLQRRCILGHMDINCWKFTKMQLVEFFAHELSNPGM